MYRITMTSVLISFSYLALIIQVDGKVLLQEKEFKSGGDMLSRERRAFDRSACDKKYLDENNDHTMCLVDVGTAGPTLSDADKAAIIDEHNNFRKNVKPTATNMLKAIWDNNMAVVAAKWARQCIVSHDDSHARAVPELPGVYIGQNLAAGYSSFVAAVKGWHSEVNNFKYGVGAIDKSEDIGHYTQVVSATVSRIGCGLAKCPNSKTFYVCNYAVGQMGMIKPYKSGTSCADCDKSCSGDSHLCDCGGKLCYNGGNLDPNTCTCTCPSKYYSGDLCETSSCPSQVSQMCASYEDDACKKFANIPSECPLMCGKCGTLPCGGKICRNWGELDMATCTCKCQSTYTGDTCKTLDCSLSDSSFCSYYKKDHCAFINVKLSCPHKCGSC